MRMDIIKATLTSLNSQSNLLAVDKLIEAEQPTNEQLSVLAGCVPSEILDVRVARLWSRPQRAQKKKNKLALIKTLVHISGGKCDSRGKYNAI